MTCSQQISRRLGAIALYFFVLLTLGLTGCPVRQVAQRIIPPPKPIPLHPKKSGYPRWIFPATERIVSTPAVGLGTVYIGSLDRKLFAINSRTGKKRWVFGENGEMDGLVLSSPATTADGSTVYITSKDGNLYAISDQGKLKWKFRTQNEIDSSPKVGIDGTIYVASQDTNLYALPADTGSGSAPNPKWQYNCKEKVKGSSPEFSAAGDLVYIASVDGTLHAVPLTQTSKYATAKWARKVCDKITSTPKADTDGTIYVSCWGRYPQKEADDKLKGEIKAIKPNGDVKWSFKTDGPILSSPVLGPNGNIYIGSDDKIFYAINKKGDEVWRFKSGVYIKGKKGTKRVDGSGGYIQATAAINQQNGNIFFGSINEYLYALTPKGKLLWQFDTRGWVDNAPVPHGRGDIIYVAAGSRLFAMNP